MLPGFEKFIGDLRAIWAADSDNQRRMERAKPLLEQLVKDESLRVHSARWPSTEGHKNLLLYVDPQYGFVINGVVRVPGRKGACTTMPMPGCSTACSMEPRVSSAMIESMTGAGPAMPR